jgi:hypothetical protein
MNRHPKGLFGSLPIDYTGQKIGKLTVLGVFRRSPAGSVVWNCLCECGRTPRMWQGSLRKKKALGCRSCSRIKPDAALRHQYHYYQKSARVRNYVFDLTLLDFETLTSQNCYYCGAEPANVCQAAGGSTYTRNGIDRANNDLGYVLENCVSCCADCNYFKRARNKEAFLEKIARIYKHRIEEKTACQR